MNAVSPPAACPSTATASAVDLCAAAGRRRGGPRIALHDTGRCHPRFGCRMPSAGEEQVRD
jgi:hypothetical protein